MDSIVISLPHQPTCTLTNTFRAAGLHEEDTQSVTMILSSSHPGGEAMEAEGTADDLAECETIAATLRVLEGACTTAMLAAYDRTTASASLELLRKSFTAAKQLRTILMLESNNLLSGRIPSLVDITGSLERSLEALHCA